MASDLLCGIKMERDKKFIARLVASEVVECNRVCEIMNVQDKVRVI